MKILGIDFEATDKVPLTARITEVGAVLYDYSGGVYTKLTEYNPLVYAPDYPLQNQEVIEVTGITDEMLKEKGEDPGSVILHLNGMLSQVDYVFAHNKGYDQVLLTSEAARLNLPLVPRPWLCTYTEIEYAKKYKCKKLSHLAYDHGILVHPDTLHRASADVELMMMLVAKYPLQDIIEYAQSPWIYVRAVVPKPWEDNKAGTNWAKAQGFGWEGAPGTDKPRFDKLWVKRIKEKYLARETQDTLYKVVKLDTPKEG